MQITLGNQQSKCSDNFLKTKLDPPPSKFHFVDRISSNKRYTTLITISIYMYEIAQDSQKGTKTCKHIHILTLSENRHK